MSKLRLAALAITETDLLRRMREAFRDPADGTVKAGTEVSGQDLGLHLYLVPEAYWREIERAEGAGWVVRFERDKRQWFRLTENGRVATTTTKLQVR
jgi:hypothetical protein